jgi:two-component system, NarL family, response regulator LiaR
VATTLGAPHLAFKMGGGRWPPFLSWPQTPVTGSEAEDQIQVIDSSQSTMKRHVLIFGLAGGLLIATLQLSEYRFLIIEHSFELYGALIAILFSSFGIWLGLRITRRREILVREVPGAATTPAPSIFAPDTKGQDAAGITARELEVLTLVARGLSNREIASQLFVSENTIKTHCAHVFGKLGASRRTQAVQRGKELGLLP